MNKNSFYIGIDEMGRGPLAGALYVCACGVSHLRKLPKSTNTLPLRDSKKLSSKQREQWWMVLEKKKKDGDLYIAYTQVSPHVIDTKGISYATRYGATHSAMKLLQTAGITSGRVRIVLDGNLYVDKDTLAQRFPECVFQTKTIVRGDETEPIISIASIYGKVMRDRYMVRMDKTYPHYGFRDHKGYGTKKHMKAIQQYGVSKIHRKSFLTRFDF